MSREPRTGSMASHLDSRPSEASCLGHAVARPGRESFRRSCFPLWLIIQHVNMKKKIVNRLNMMKSIWFRVDDNPRMRGPIWAADKVIPSATQTSHQPALFEPQVKRPQQVIALALFQGLGQINYTNASHKKCTSLWTFLFSEGLGIGVFSWGTAPVQELCRPEPTLEPSKAASGPGSPTRSFLKPISI